MLGRSRIALTVVILLRRRIAVVGRRTAVAIIIFILRLEFFRRLVIQFRISTR